MVALNFLTWTEFVLINIAGVDHVGGDMFESVPQGDAIFMKVMSKSLAEAVCMYCAYIWLTCRKSSLIS